ncbi:hypothetical protein HPB49_012755 [Dermacentor silvarum]|uniref:Uncharacterized protein n=1 Tax=Dermacentor silvarum TaxID=543639 RepID=A0ACB8CRG3_DERSI|nr:hypothetical protein HPB49_012755 [Dermacentor silvarum]
MAVVDSSGDGGTLKNCAFGKALVKGDPHLACYMLPGTTTAAPHVLVGGDEAFQLRRDFMRPFPSKHLEDEKGVSNYSLSRAREINKNKRTGSGCIRWPFYWELHKFLETLPINDATLVCESACSDDATVEQILRQMEVGDPAADDQPEPPPDKDMLDVPPSPCAEENALPAPTAHSNEAEETGDAGEHRLRGALLLSDDSSESLMCLDECLLYR